LEAIIEYKMHTTDKDDTRMSFDVTPQMRDAWIDLQNIAKKILEMRHKPHIVRNVSSGDAGSHKEDMPNNKREVSPVQRSFATMLNGFLFEKFIDDGPVPGPQQQQFISKALNIHGGKKLFARAWNNAKKENKELARAVLVLELSDAIGTMMDNFLNEVSTDGLPNLFGELSSARDETKNLFDNSHDSEDLRSRLLPYMTANPLITIRVANLINDFLKGKINVYKQSEDKIEAILNVARSPRADVTTDPRIREAVNKIARVYFGVDESDKDEGENLQDILDKYADNIASDVDVADFVPAQISEKKMIKVLKDFLVEFAKKESF